jgi:hypothetical protein
MVVGRRASLTGSRRLGGCGSDWLVAFGASSAPVVREVEVVWDADLRASGGVDAFDDPQKDQLDEDFACEATRPVGF